MILLTVNGEISDEPETARTAISPDFLSHDGVFETLRIYGGEAFRLEEHVQRMKRAAQTVDIVPPSWLLSLSRAEVARAERAGLKNAIFRITLSRGSVTGNSGLPGSVITYAAELPPFSETCYARGIDLVTSRERRNEFDRLAGIKTTSSLKRILEYRTGDSSRCDDILFLDSAGHVSEALASNVFCYHSGQLRTPPTICGALPGITRSAAISIASRLGVPVMDSAPVTLSDLLSAAEIFLTSSIREIVPVRSVDGNPVGSGEPGSVTRRIMNEYRTITRRSRQG